MATTPTTPPAPPGPPVATFPTANFPKTNAQGESNQTFSAANYASLDKLAAAIQASDPYGGSRNPLKQFRSYSYQFVLFACGTTDTFDALSESGAATTMQTFLHSTNYNPARPEYSKYGIKTLPDVPQKSANSGKYIVVINSAQDADLLINNFEHDSVFTNNGDFDDRGLSYASTFVQGKMKIFEPFGGVFFDILEFVSSSFGVSIDQLVWGLKIMFIGHTDGADSSGTQSKTTGLSTVQTIHIKSVAMTLIDIAASFSSSGGIYDIDWGYAANSAAHDPTITKNKAFAVRVPAPVTIESAISALIAKLNSQQVMQPNTVPASRSVPVRYVAWFIDPLDPTGNSGTVPLPTSTTSTQINSQGGMSTQINSQGGIRTYENKPVQQRHFKYWPIDNVTSSQRDSAGLQLPADLNKSVEQIMEGLLAMSSKYAAAREPNPSASTKNNPIYRIRIINWVQNEDTETVVNYALIREELPLLTAINPDPAEKSTVDAMRDTEMGAILQDAYQNNNVLIYDYIFSGKNVDVLDFEMKITSAKYTIVQWHLAKNQTNQKDVMPNGNNSTILGAMQNPTQATTNRVSPGTQPGAPLNAANPAQFTSYYQFMAQLVSFDLARVTLKILGNPFLLNGTLRNGSDYEKLLTAGISTNIRSDQVMQNWETKPGIVKINVYMPNKKFNPTDPHTPLAPKETPLGNTMTYREQFWYKGLFRIVTVKSTFADGQFTQVLELNALPDMGMLPSTVPAKAPTASLASGSARTAGGAQAITSKNIPPGTPPNVSSVIPPSPQAAANLKAFMLMIRKGEGTLGDQGYYKLFGDGPGVASLTNLNTYPNIVVRRGNYSSSAAGAYQIIKGTWANIQSAIGATDFQPATQDKACIYLIQQRGALQDVYDGNTQSAISKCSHEWASLPFSPYGQPTQTLSSALAFYQTNGGTIVA